MPKKKLKKAERIKLKIVIYFLFGFFLNLLALIIGLIWLKFKTKTYRKNKLIALLAGFGTYCIYTFILTPYVLQPIIQPKIDQAFFTENPDAGKVTQAIQQKYPDAKIFVKIDTNYFTYNGTTTETTVFSVQHRSTQRLLTSKEMQDIAKQTCSIIESQKKEYDKVKIFSLKYILPLKMAEVHWSLQESCKEWTTEDFSNVKIPL